MAAEEEDLIAKHNMYLLYHLRPSVKRIIKYLHEEQVLVPQDTENILSQAADTMKTQHLLNKLREIGKRSLDFLYAATLFTRIWPAADVLEPKKRPHKEEEDQEPLPEKWPSDDHFQSLSEKTLGVKPVDEKNTKMKEKFDNPQKFNVYKMDQECRGRALIINNHEFDNWGKRHGTDEDKKGLEIILKALKFDVKVAVDLTAKKMKDMLEAECKEDHSKYDCFILVILSHGDLNGIVYGTDGFKRAGTKENYLKIGEIVDAFSKVATLAKKPKLFIIQACRGTNEKADQIEEPGDSVQKGEEEGEEEEKVDKMELDDDEEKEDDSPSQHMDQPQQSTSVFNPSNAATSGTSQSKDSFTDTRQGNTEERESSEDEANDAGLETANQKQPLNNTEDLTEGKPLHFLVALPTTEGNVSWRNKHKGSWFIQAFIYVLANYAYKEDLDMLMLKVNELVRRAGGPQLSEVPEFESTLIKRVFFFPGMEKKA